MVFNFVIHSICVVESPARNAFQQASQISSPVPLCGVLVLTTMFLVLQGVQVVADGKSRWVDSHWHRGMSYLKIGWNWIRLAITRQWGISVHRFLSSAPDPYPAMASFRQSQRAFERKFVVLSHFPAS